LSQFRVHTTIFTDTTGIWSGGTYAEEREQSDSGWKRWLGIMKPSLPANGIAFYLVGLGREIARNEVL
jgi:hypothetical protein